MKPARLKQNFGIAPTPEPAAVAAAKRVRKAVEAAANPPCAERTEVAARIDVGLGNTVYIRGQGDGLSWNKGTPLVCQAASKWVWTTSRAQDKVVFKLLLNDIVWARGEDVVVEPGRSIEVVPVF